MEPILKLSTKVNYDHNISFFLISTALPKVVIYETLNAWSPWSILYRLYVNYDSRDIPDKKIAHITTLDS